VTLLWIACAVVISALATARLTRFITTDWLGEWLIVGPAKRWAARVDGPEPTPEQYMVLPGVRRWKLVKGLSCPFCVGFWIGLLIIIGSLTLGRLPIIEWGWWVGLGALALNYLVGHLSSKID
jgi:hypothetical protein